MKIFTPFAGRPLWLELPLVLPIRFTSGSTARIRLVLAVLAFGACLVSQANAQFGIDVQNTQYTTYVMVQAPNESGTITQLGDFQLWSWGSSRMTASGVPISDEMYAPVSGILGAQAGTEMFGVSANSSMGGPGHLVDYEAGAQNATAGAESEICFSPLTSGTANIELNFFGNYEYFYSQAFVSLIDLTSGQTLWNYGWDSPATISTIPWQQTSTVPVSATLALETGLKSTDSYELDMYAQTFSDADDEMISIQLSGLDVAQGSPTFVPEPSTFALLGLAAMLLLFRRVPRWSLSRLMPRLGQW